MALTTKGSQGQMAQRMTSFGDWNMRKICNRPLTYCNRYTSKNTAEKAAFKARFICFDFAHSTTWIHSAIPLVMTV